MFISNITFGLIPQLVVVGICLLHYFTALQLELLTIAVGEQDISFTGCQGLKQYSLEDTLYPQNMQGFMRESVQSRRLNTNLKLLASHNLSSKVRKLCLHLSLPLENKQM